MERARLDKLTGALNRRYFEEELARDFSYSRRHEEPLALMLLDIDHFERIKADCGHAAGDVALMAVGTIIHFWVRAGDPVARFRGNEFAVLCRGVSGLRAFGLAIRLKDVIADERVCVGAGKRVAMTASIGVATYPGERLGTAFDLLAAARRALDLAKAQGRNRVAVMEEVPL